MHVPVADCSVRKDYNTRTEISAGTMGYFFYNFIMYKIFILATDQKILLP
jgi:hypothetical protein